VSYIVLWVGLVAGATLAQPLILIFGLSSMWFASLATGALAIVALISPRAREREILVLVAD
jgi:uncharacterized membrane protein YoaK (UPF0700 family)